MLKILARLDVVETGHGKGSHVGVRGPTGQRSLVQDKNLPPSFVATILKQLGIDEEQFLAAANKRR